MNSWHDCKDWHPMRLAKIALPILFIVSSTSSGEARWLSSLFPKRSQQTCEQEPNPTETNIANINKILQRYGYDLQKCSKKNPRQERESILLSARASEAAYKVFERATADFGKNIDFNPLIRDGKAIRGFSVPASENVAKDPSLVPEGYQMSYVVDGAPIDEETGKKDPNGGVFSVVYEPCPKKKGLAPIVAFMGSKRKVDWKNNLFNRGAKYLRGLFSAIFEIPSDSKKDPHEDASGWKHLFSELHKKYPEEKLIWTGHSLGGAFAGNVAKAADYYLKKREKASVPMQIYTFNTLNDGLQLMSLNGFFSNAIRMAFGVPHKKSVSMPDNMDATHLTTRSDPLQSYNVVLGGTNQGFQMTLVRHTPRFRGIMTEHSVATVREDYLHTLDLPSALSDLNRQIAHAEIDRDLARSNTLTGANSRYEEQQLRLLKEMKMLLQNEDVQKCLGIY